MIYLFFRIYKKISSDTPDKILFERSNTLYIACMVAIIQALFFISYKVVFSRYTKLSYMDLMYGFIGVCILLFIYEDLLKKRK